MSAKKIVFVICSVTLIVCFGLTGVQPILHAEDDIYQQVTNALLETFRVQAFERAEAQRAIEASERRIQMDRYIDAVEQIAIGLNNNCITPAPCIVPQPCITPMPCNPNQRSCPNANLFGNSAGCLTDLYPGLTPIQPVILPDIMLGGCR